MPQRLLLGTLRLSRCLPLRLDVVNRVLPTGSINFRALIFDRAIYTLRGFHPIGAKPEPLERDADWQREKKVSMRRLIPAVSLLGLLTLGIAGPSWLVLEPARAAGQQAQTSQTPPAPQHPSLFSAKTGSWQTAWPISIRRRNRSTRSFKETSRTQIWNCASTATRVVLLPSSNTTTTTSPT